MNRKRSLASILRAGLTKPARPSRAGVTAHETLVLGIAVLPVMLVGINIIGAGVALAVSPFVVPLPSPHDTPASSR